MNFALIQSNIRCNDVERNHVHLGLLIERAAELGAHVVVLPEMFNTGFTFASGELAEEANTLGLRFLEAEAKKFGIVLCGTLPNLQKRLGLFNTMYVVSSSGLLAEYSKMHLFSYGGESKLYTPGNRTVTLMMEDVRVSLFICYDLRFADVFFDLAYVTDVYIVCANWPSSRQHHWDSLLSARAIENLAYVVGVNRVGSSGNTHYTGSSRIISPTGKILAYADDKEDVICADVYAQNVAKIRQKYGFLNDRILSSL